MPRLCDRTRGQVRDAGNIDAVDNIYAGQNAGGRRRGSVHMFTYNPVFKVMVEVSITAFSPLPRICGEALSMRAPGLFETWLKIRCPSYTKKARSI